ncbi:MAG: hypothetical protein F6J87_30590 [Spirulina sp. SIO3F2]|nr:hypothetical protein [Spirulina sp. SIO3F2]
MLTALDPSGYFAQQYNKTINIFLATNILPSMYGFTGKADSFELIKEYLEAFVAQNIDSEDKDIAQAAQQIKNILDQKNADRILKESIKALNSLAETVEQALALPIIAEKWLTWFSTKFPTLSKVGNIFGSVLIGGITGLAIFNLFSEYKDWDKLSPGQKAAVITDTVQLGLQILAAVVKRGVNIAAIFNVDGMSALQRVAAVSRILAQGEASQVDAGLVKIGNTTARWLSGVAGSVEEADDLGLAALFGEEEEEQVSWTARIFGNNLDEFIATRIGPVFILAGIALSIYFIATGASGLDLAANIINIVGASLALFGLVGGWLVEGGIIAAEGTLATMIAFAGPLAIVAALVGLGLMLYELFHTPPDPVKEFVDDYVKPAGFYVAAKDSAIDYALPYADTNNGNLLMKGFTLTSGEALVANPDGSISLGSATALPSCVWNAQTNGVGMSQIATIIAIQKEEQNSSNQETETVVTSVFLSLMSDHTISFQPKMSSTQNQANTTNGQPTVLTQTWLSHPQGDATTTTTANKEESLVSLGLTFQPVLPDSKGNYAPSQASGWLVATSSGVGYSDSSGTTFTLNMSGLAPNFMKMVNLSFLQSSSSVPIKPSTSEQFAPSYGIKPSTPLTYSLTGSLPSFLSFSSKTGVISPNGQSTPTTTSQTACSITVNSTQLSNNGSATADFTIAVTPLPAG